MSAPTLFIVVPTYDAAAPLRGLLSQLAGERVIVSDGGSGDGTRCLAVAGGAVLAVGAKGRGGQLRLGAKHAILMGGSDDWFLFVHADSTLPEGWRAAVDRAIAEGDPRYFRFHADATGVAARFMDAMVGLRCRALGLPYGDQGLLISRALYQQLGGYADMVLFEDVDMVERVRRVARLRPLPVAMTTDVSRHRRDGLWRRGLRNLRLLWRYKRGADLDALLKAYRA
ncbi:MAG: hypothetical protein WBG08_12035 [Litorimonas sp.]